MKKPKSVTMKFPGVVEFVTGKKVKKATAKEIQKEQERLSCLVAKSAMILSGVSYEKMLDKFEDTIIEEWVASLEGLRKVLWRFADSLL